MTTEIQRLKNLRQKLNLSQEHIAKKLYVARVTLARWEANKHTPQPIYRKEIKKVINRLERKLA